MVGDPHLQGCVGDGNGKANRTFAGMDRGVSHQLAGQQRGRLHQLGQAPPPEALGHAVAGLARCGGNGLKLSGGDAVTLSCPILSGPGR